MNAQLTKQSFSTAVQLCTMMFMQYMLSAVWWVPLAAYLSHTLKLEVYQVSLVLSAMAIGAMASSFIGAIADRYFAAEKILAVLNLLTGIFLLLAAQQTTFAPLMACVVLAMLCHMPTQSLTSTIAMSHTPSEQFPRIRMFGSVGWVASGIFSVVALHVMHLRFIQDIIVGALAVQVICALLNGFMKMSTHAAASGAVVGALLAYSQIFFFDPTGWLCLTVILAGAVGTSRLILRQHTLTQIGVSTLVGFLCGFVSILI